MRTLPALLIAVSLTCGATLRAQPDLAALDAYLADALVKFDQPGLAVGVVKDGQLVWSKGYGKLDLAKAAQGMGDVEGAREILQEVLHEGDEQQKAEAQSLIARLG